MPIVGVMVGIEEEEEEEEEAILLLTLVGGGDLIFPLAVLGGRIDPLPPSGFVIEEEIVVVAECEAAVAEEEG